MEELVKFTPDRFADRVPAFRFVEAKTSPA